MQSALRITNSHSTQHAELAPLAVRSEAWVCGRSLAVGKLCVSCERCVLSGTGVCDGQVTRPEDPTE